MNETSDAAAIIRLFHVCRQYLAKNALKDLSLDIHRSEFLFVTGPSGAGKTTLLKLLYRGETVTAGQVLVDGINISRLSRKRVHFLRRKFGIIFQDYKLIPSRTVFENVALVLEAAGRSARYVRKKTTSVLRTVGIEDRMKAYPPALSGGEQQRVAVARAVVGSPAIILADEPTGSLDAQSADHVMALLKAFHTRGATVIVATHDRALISSIPARVVYLNEGQMVPAPHV